MFEQAVQAGIAVLEEKRINWRPAASHPQLNMKHPEECVLGRTVNGGYWAAFRQWDVTENWMEQHGFFITDETLEVAELEYDEMYLELAEAWRQAAKAVTA